MTKTNDAVVMAFMEAVYPGNTELALSMFNERTVLKEATKVIEAQRKEIKRLEEHGIKQDEYVQWQRDQINVLAESYGKFKAVAEAAERMFLCDPNEKRVVPPGSQCLLLYEDVKATRKALKAGGYLKEHEDE